MLTTDSQLRAAWQAPAFSRETIHADPWTAVYLPIPENLPASFGVFTLQDARALVREMMVATVEPNDWEPVEGRLTFDKLALADIPTTDQRIAALEARIAKLEAAAAQFEEHRQGWIKLGELLEKDWHNEARRSREKKEG
jgi:hypothetical protein